MSATDSDLYELAMSDEAQPLMAAVKNHIAKNVEPITEEFYALDAEKPIAGLGILGNWNFLRARKAQQKMPAYGTSFFLMRKLAKD